MQGRGRHIATDTNSGIATNDFNVSWFIACRLCRLCLAGQRRCHDRQKLGCFRCLAIDAWRIVLARSVLPPPFEKHVGVQPIAPRQFRNRYVRFAGLNGQSTLELRRVIGPASPSPHNNFICIQNGPRYFIWRTPLSLTATLFARRPQSDAYLRKA